MYAVEVRDHIMIAHSFSGEVFGAASRKHGATFVVDVAFFCDRLTADNIVLDIDLAHAELKAALEPLNYRDLDTLKVFEGRQTTTEFLSKHIFDALDQSLRANRFGPSAGNIMKMRVTLRESHVARAWYEAPVSTR